MELKRKLAFVKFLVEDGEFYPFLETTRGTLVGLTTTKKLALPGSVAHRFHCGMSGARDIQMAIDLEGFGRILLPHSWHYTMSYRLEGFECWIGEIDPPPEEKWRNTRPLRMHWAVFRAMLALVEDAFTPVEHGIFHRKQMGKFKRNPHPHIKFETTEGAVEVMPNPVYPNKVRVRIPGICSKEGMDLYFDLPRYWEFVEGGRRFLEKEKVDFLEEEHRKFLEEEKRDFFVREKVNGVMRRRPVFRIHRRKCAVTGREFYTAFYHDSLDQCWGFEEKQAPAVLEGGEETYNAFRWVEQRRLGDIIILKEDSSTLPVGEPFTVPQLEGSKLEYVGDDDRGILYHPDHGGIYIEKDEKIYPLQYVRRGHD